MSDEELQRSIDEMVGMFGPFPDPEHSPAQFAYLVKLYKYYKPIEERGMVHERRDDEGAAQQADSPEGELREEAG